MNFTQIFEMQTKLDQAILKNLNLSHYQLQTQRILALIVEISEFANEIASFKYWKKNKKTIREKVLEEFIDGIHFYVSISISLNLAPKIKPKIITKDLNEQLLAVFKSITYLTEEFTTKAIEQSFSLYLGLANLCDISEQEIQTHYLSKNKINYQRIADNY